MGEKEYEYVWLEEERTFAELVTLGAHCSIVRYSREGIDYEILIDNDEFNFTEGENNDDGGGT